MKKFLLTHITLITFIIILCIAAFLRLYKLDVLPAGLSWDEAAIGYNGYGILTVHRDEWLNKMPLTFKSFGDYKAAVAVYMNTISIALFGLNEFAIRLPMAVSGIVTTIAAFFIGTALFKEKRHALLLMLLVGISPLNVHFSRIAFESGIAAMFVAVGFACLLHADKKRWLYLGGFASLAISLYTYHSCKIAVPLFLVIYAVKFWPTIQQQKRWVIASVVLFTVMVVPLARETLYGHAADRFFMASQITNGKELKPLPEVIGILAKNYLSHLNPAFSLFGKSSTYRHGNGEFGILSFVEAALILVGIVACVKDKKMRQYWWVLAMVMAAILPASIGDDAPHSNRAHLIIPWMQVIGVFGAQYLSRFVPKHMQMKATVALLLFLLVQVLWQMKTYAMVYSTEAVKDFQYGYREAVLFAKSREGSVDKVLFTSAYGQPYIFVLLYKKLDPIQYQQGALANYEIRDLNWPSDKSRTDTLIVGTSEEIPSDAEHIVKEILYPDGEVVFRIVEQ